MFKIKKAIVFFIVLAMITAPAALAFDVITTFEEVPLTVMSYDHNVYIYGYPDGTFLPEKSITRAEAAMIFYRLLPGNYRDLGFSIGTSPIFPDVKDDAWYGPEVGLLTDFEIITGYEDGTFRPGNPITRAEFIAMSYRFFDLIDEAGEVSGVEGYEDGTFRPDQSVTRAEVVKIINTKSNRLPLSLPKNIINPFSDVGANHWAYTYIMEASTEHLYLRVNGIEEWIMR